MAEERFGARWWFLLAVALSVSALTFRLGLWQLDRATQKETIYAQQQAQMHLPALGNADLLLHSDARAELYRPVKLQGQWAGELTVYLDNRSHQGQPGFLVLTPLCLRDKTCVLVIRGWAARDRVSSAKLPPVTTPSDGQIDGIKVNPPSHMMELSSSRSETMMSSPFEVLRQNIKVDEYEKETGLRIIATVQQLGEPGEGLIRQTPNILLGSDKNKAYAAQWFALSALCLGVFVWFQIVKKNKHG